MGNCVFGGGGGDEGEQSVEQMIKVVTSTGGMMELYAPITAGCVTNEFPGHDLFCGGGGGGRPLFPYENLHVGLIYHLIPNSDDFSTTVTATTTTTSAITPYRMSNIVSCSSSSSSRSNNHVMTSQQTRVAGRCLDSQGRQISEEIRRLEEMDVVRPAGVRYSNGTSTGVWKVRLVIDPEQLSEILSQEVKTGELIESVRTVARCGGGRKSSSSTTGRGGESGGGLGLGWSRWNGAAAQ